MASSTAEQGRPARLAVSNIVKRYPGTTALRGVGLTLRPGEIHALAGQNGAGKSTLIRILAGVEDADEGEIIYNGEVVRPRVRKLPIAFIHQDLALVETMTVAENLALYTDYPRVRGLIHWRKLARDAKVVLDRIGADIDPLKTVAELSIAERSMVAIGRALANDVEVLVLDEPTAALPAADVEVLFATLRHLKAQGVAMLYVSHRMDEIFAMADYITVFRDGEVVMACPATETNPRDIVHAIAGRAIENVFPQLSPPQVTPLLSVGGLRVDAFGPIDFVLHHGEILSLVGLRGAGQEAIGRALFGALSPSTGRIELDAVNVPRGIAGAIGSGIGFVSGRRAEEAICSTITVRENLFLNPSFLRASPIGFREAEQVAAKASIARFGIWPVDPERLAATLSGGNQQKVVVARWVAAASRVLVLEEPTAGVDVGAKSDIYGILAELLADGHACILVSSDFDEVAGLAHRALVFDRGRVVKELWGEHLTAAAISLYASGQTEMKEAV